MPATTAQAEGGSFEHTAFDGSTPPKSSSLDPKVLGQLLVSLDPKASNAVKELDLEGVLEFQRA